MGIPSSWWSVAACFIARPRGMALHRYKSHACRTVPLGARPYVYPIPYTKLNAAANPAVIMAP